MDVQTVDTVVVVAANIMNLLMVGIFLSRPLGKPRLERTLGGINILLGIPLLGAVIFNLQAGREWWTYVLPTVMLLFLIVELILDYILRSDFRMTRLLWPYLLLFYLAQWMMIGYAFQVNNTYGFITLATYFLSLFATAYSYSKVGHGER